jgi:hypothetical protein
MLRDRSFKTLLLEAVDEGLSSLGDSSKEVIYFHLAKSFNINKLDIPYKIEEFADAIEKIFGLGANFLEILIMKSLYEKAGQPFEYNQEQEALVFAEYVAAVKQGFLKKKNRISLNARK